jgi:hypothetical protein
MSMENLMKALMESAAQSQQQAPHPQAGGDMLSEVLGGLMGGGQQAPQQTGGDMLSGVLGGLMGGAQQAAPQQSGDLVSGILGSLMGGPQGGNHGDNMLGALEQIIGGQPGQGQTLGINQGAAMNMGMNNPAMALIQPMVNQLAAKAKIPPQIATMVVSIALHYLLSSHPSTSTKAPMNLGSFMQELSSGNVSADTLHNSGMVKDVMQTTGLNQQDAVKSLNATFGALGAHVQGMGNSSR